MRIIAAIVRKEFKQIVRNKFLIRIIFAMPVLQMVILVYAANFEMKNISLGVIDQDRSTFSRSLTDRLSSSSYFQLKDHGVSRDDAMQAIATDQIDLLIEIPHGFENDIYRGDQPRIVLTANAINAMKASLASSYASGIMNDWAKEKSTRMITDTYSAGQLPPSQIEVTHSNFFNPRLDYKTLMLPGVLGILITVIGIMLTAINIVKEKEQGTIEQINVTPIRPVEFIIGKIVPFGVIGLLQFTLGILVAVFFFDLTIKGNLWLLYGVVTIYLIAVLGVGFLISTISNTQIQAMFTTMFFTFIFILLSGLFTPTEPMPQWAQWLNMINPIAYLVEVIRLVILKGSGLHDIMRQFVAIVSFAVISNSLIIWRYRKSS